MKNKLYAVILILVVLICGCSSAQVYDNAEALASNFNNYNKFSYKQSTHDKTTTITCSKMEGMDTIWKYNASEDMNLEMSYFFEVTSGKAKVVLIQPDDTVLTLIEQEASESEEKSQKETDLAEENDAASSKEPAVTLELKKGSNRMKIVCEKDTAFSLEFKVQ